MEKIFVVLGTVGLARDPVGYVKAESLEQVAEFLAVRPGKTYSDGSVEITNPSPKLVLGLGRTFSLMELLPLITRVPATS